MGQKRGQNQSYTLKTMRMDDMIQEGSMEGGEKAMWDRNQDKTSFSGKSLGGQEGTAHFCDYTMAKVKQKEDKNKGCITDRVVILSYIITKESIRLETSSKIIMKCRGKRPEEIVKNTKKAEKRNRKEKIEGEETKEANEKKCQKARDRTISVSGSTAREGVFIQTFRKEVEKPKDSGEEEVL
ncbi:hypothetical protein JEQ12_020239 [Ovis aries]|uniref:Uncharacterized protein n=1 Tax=Ovis aries TaxID=9940 RepID=A0A835ZRC6_SHEEP|nr:hypothetical protein JEQ12_020239 [Ovis aries]